MFTCSLDTDEGFTGAVSSTGGVGRVEGSSLGEEEKRSSGEGGEGFGKGEYN